VSCAAIEPRAVGCCCCARRGFPSFAKLAPVPSEPGAARRTGWKPLLVTTPVCRVNLNGPSTRNFPLTLLRGRDLSGWLASSDGIGKRFFGGWHCSSCAGCGGLRWFWRLARGLNSAAYRASARMRGPCVCLAACAPPRISASLCPSSGGDLLRGRTLLGAGVARSCFFGLLCASGGFVLRSPEAGPWLWPRRSTGGAPWSPGFVSAKTGGLLSAGAGDPLHLLRRRRGRGATA